MTDTIHAALVAAQAQLTNPTKDGKANYGAYTTLAGVLDHVRPILAGHGLYVSQYVTNDDTHVRVTTSISHTSGESIDCGDVTWPMPDKVQVFGGLITYLRRYALTAALGLSGADDDDDGHAANDQAKRPPRTSGSRAVRAEARASEKQVAYLSKLMREQKINEVTLNDFAKDRFGWELPTDGLAHLTAVHASDLIDALTKAKTPGRDYTPPPGRDGSPTHDGPPDDPWASTPLVDPVTGEVAS